jgi:hypothetical protein
MNDENHPRNRKERRAAAREDGRKSSNSSSVEIKLTHPNRSKPKTKTLLEIAEEKRAQLEKEHPDKLKSWTSEHEDEDESLGPFGESIVYSVALSMIHFTLDILVFYQYRREIEWKEIFFRAARVLPALFCILYLFRTKMANQVPQLKQMFFFTLSVSAGCYLIYSGNKNGYYYVMQTAPALGTLWVWSCVEMQLAFAVAHVIVIVVYTWWNSFTTF